MHVPHKPFLLWALRTGSYSQRHSFWDPLINWLITRAAFLFQISPSIYWIFVFALISFALLDSAHIDMTDCLVARIIMVA